MSYRQIPLRALTALAATAGALAPVMESLARHRRKRRPNDDDDDDRTLTLLQRRRRRRQEADDDDDDIASAALRARRRQAAQERDDNNDEDAAEPSTAQSIAADLGIRDTVAERIDAALSGGGGGGGGDEPNIEVTQDGDSLLVVTKDIEFAGDSEGFDVETGGISYSSGAGGGLTDDFTS